MLNLIYDEFRNNWQYRKITQSLFTEIDSFLKSHIKNYEFSITDDRKIIITLPETTITLG